MKLDSQRKDLVSTLINQLWRLVSGPLTMLLIPLFLTPTDQGYWYLFGSISALSVLADLGFSNIILQFSAHEFAHLSFDSKGLLVGDEYHLKRIGSFFKFTLKWTSSICLIVFPIIFIVGIWFFNRDGVLGKYLLPWTIFSIGSLILFFNNTVLSYIEGLNKIEVVQYIRFWVAVVNTVVVSTTLILGGNIYALAFGLFVSASSIILFLFFRFRLVLSQVLAISKGFHYKWSKEVLPLFSRYAFSFFSGYFIFQIYTPFMQYFHGPIQSGKVGITLVLITAIFSMSNIWIYTITPRMNILVSQNNKVALDTLFRKRLILAAITYITISIGLFGFLAIFKDFWILPKIISRFLPIQALVMVLVCYFFQLIVNSWATYLRAHKKEPYMIPSLILAVWIALATAFVGHIFPPQYFFIGFLSSYVWWLPVAYIIYKRCQIKWYGN
jgi:O-antigen/teichoic acid export membrane protein